jgi:site-specific recombinase XerC
MQEVRRFRPSTVSRRFSVAAGFYRTCVLDGVLPHSPAEHVRRPSVPAESPMLGFTHLQFEALLTAARESANPYDFALVAMLGLLGLRIFEATSADIADLGEEHGHRVLRVCGKGTKIVLVPLPPAVGRAIDRAVGARIRGPILLNTRGARMDRHAATRRLRHLARHAGVPITRPHPLSRPGARFRCYHRPVSPDRSPDPPCASPRNGLSAAAAIRRGSQVAMGMGSCSPGRRSGRPPRPGSGSTPPRPPRSATARQR